MNSPSRNWLFVLIVLSSLALLLIAPFLGQKFISPLNLFHTTNSLDSILLFHLRVPRVLSAWIAGAGLAMGGMVFQALFRNPLATPYTLGIASGASFGAAISLQMGFLSFLPGIFGISLWSFLGALLSLSIVYAVYRHSPNQSSGTMLLAGVAVSFFFSSLILFVQYLSDFTQSFQILHWIMGGLQDSDYSSLIIMIPAVTIGGLILYVLSPQLDLISTGEDLAASRGISVNALRRTAFFTTSLMVASIVSVCGPIGFVGMMIPHICRMLLGSKHQLLTPASIFAGGLFLVFSDTIARTLIAPVEIPVGILTALLGGPYFFWLLLRKSKVF